MVVQIKKVSRKVKFLATFFLVYGLVSFSTRKVLAATNPWKEHTPSDLASYTWHGLASSANGKDLAVVHDGGNKVWLSTDYGVNWAEIGSTSDWASVAMSSDGQEIAVIGFSGYMELSLNGGADWSQPCVEVCHGTGDWYSITMSGDGQYLAAADVAGYQIWVSNNFGADWTEADPSHTHWLQVAYSRDGDTLVAVPNGGYIAVSTNHGEDWTTGLASDSAWTAVAAGNGGHIAAVANGGDLDTTNILTSNNNGANWTDTGFGSEYFFWPGSLGLSDSGQVLLAAPHNNNNLQISTNGGAKFKVQNNTDQIDWESVALSSDGTRMAAGGYSSVFTYKKSTTSSGGGSVPVHSVVVPVIEEVAPLAVVPTPPSTPPPTPDHQVYVVITSILKLGSKGDEVKSLQNILGITVDGMFGPKTQAAVIIFQKNKGLVADGIVGPKTRAALGF